MNNAQALGKPQFTVGFATYQDYYGAWPTIHSWRRHHARALSRCEIVIVDQTDPAHPHAKDLVGYVRQISEVPVKYVSMPSPNGTSVSRNRVIAEASTNRVLVVDSHVLLDSDETQPVGALQALLDYWDETDTEDLIHGPLIMDNLGNYHSHMERVWRGEMYGIWAMMWQCPTFDCSMRFVVMGGRVPDPSVPAGYRSRALFLRSPVEPGPKGEIQPLTECRCGKKFPEIGYERHEDALEALGYYRPGKTPPLSEVVSERFKEDDPFPIPSHGMGLFAVRKDTWDRLGGFHPKARGFGGEESWTQIKWERAGLRAICLPALRWSHRFGRPDGAPYPLARNDKVRNYLLEWLEIGRDPADIRAHFTGKLGEIDNPMPDGEFNAIVRMVEQNYYPANGFTIVGQKGPNRPGEGSDSDVLRVDALYEKFKATPRDLNEHFDTLKRFVQKAGTCKRASGLDGEPTPIKAGAHVTDLSNRKESAIALIAGRPTRLLSINTEESDDFYKAIHKAVKLERKDEWDITFTSYGVPVESFGQDQVEETDLLFINTPHNAHTAEYLGAVLGRWLPYLRRFLIVHDTSANGEKGTDGKEGLNYALRELVEDYPEWRPVYYNSNQYGLTVLSRLEEDYPETPVTAWAPGYGPGTELKKMLASIGINPAPSCDCNKKALQMDVWGVEGCRKEFDTIVKWMNEGAPKWGWEAPIKAAIDEAPTDEVPAYELLDIQPVGGNPPETAVDTDEKGEVKNEDKPSLVKVAMLAVKEGLAFKVNPKDPFPGLVREAIRRAEKEAERREIVRLEKQQRRERREAQLKKRLAALDESAEAERRIVREEGAA